MAAKTINIVPTAFPPIAAPTLSNQQRALVANALDLGAVCQPQRALQNRDAGRSSRLDRTRRRYACNRDGRGCGGLSEAASIAPIHRHQRSHYDATRAGWPGRDFHRS